MNRTQTTSRQPQMNYLDQKRGNGDGRGECSIIKICWPIELNDLWYKMIYRPKMIVWSLVLHPISYILYDGRMGLGWMVIKGHRSSKGEGNMDTSSD